MANRSYLCGCEEKKIYPSFWDSTYKAETATLAGASWKLPVMWLALFQVDDIQDHTFESQGEKIEVYAPIVAREQALKNIAVHGKVLAEGLRQPNLIQYAEAFMREVEKFDLPYLTIELEEIDCLEEGGIRGSLESVLSWSMDRDFGRALAKLAQWDFRNPILSYEEFLRSESEQGFMAADSILGGAWIRPLAWEE